MCAAVTRQPPSNRTQVWLWRAGRSVPARWNSVLAVAKSRPNVVITVLARVRWGEPPTRPRPGHGAVGRWPRAHLP